MRWKSTAGWSGICGKILTVSGFSVATSWNGSRCSITAGLSLIRRSATGRISGISCGPFPVASGWRAGRRLSERAAPAEKLLPFSDVREELPRGTFAYTDVPTMIIRLRA